LALPASSPVIGIISKFDDDCSDYETAISEADGRPQRLRASSALSAEELQVQGLLLVNGGNSREIDEHSTQLVSVALKFRRPVLAIGAGMYWLNSILGGNNSSGTSSVDRRYDWSATSIAPARAHVLSIEPWSRLARIIGATWLETDVAGDRNVHRVADLLRVAAFADQGMAAALESMDTEHFCIGIAWHPERSLDAAATRAIFRAFVEASRAPHA